MYVHLSPDSSSCDYDMFGPFNKTFGSKRSDTHSQVSKWLDTRLASFYESGAKNLLQRWEKCKIICVNIKGFFIFAWPICKIK